MKKILILTAIMALTGCAMDQKQLKNSIQARVDPISITDAVKYEADSVECAKYGAMVAEGMRNEAITRAVVGGVIGFGLGAIVGSSWGDAAWRKVGTAGAVGGAVGGVRSVPDIATMAIGNCLTNRGYKLFW